MFGRALVLTILCLALLGCESNRVDKGADSGPATLQNQNSFEVVALADGGAILIGESDNFRATLWYVREGKAVQVVETDSHEVQKVSKLTKREAWLWSLVQEGRGPIAAMKELEADREEAEAEAKAESQQLR